MKLTFDVPEELAKKIGEEIKAALDEYRKKQVWPQDGDEYYCIQGSGKIASSIFHHYSEYDVQALNLGNCFRTNEEVKFKREQLKVFHELEQLADDDQPWDGNLPHFYIQYDYRDGWIETDYTYGIKNNMFYFQTREAAQAAIDKIGEERLKKYYFCIPEE